MVTSAANASEFCLDVETFIEKRTEAKGVSEGRGKVDKK